MVKTHIHTETHTQTYYEKQLLMKKMHAHLNKNAFLS